MATKSKKITEPSIVEDIPHEEVQTSENGLSVKPEILTIEQQTNREIAKFDKAEAVIKGYKKKFGSLSIKGLDDKDGYKKVESAWREVRDARIGFEKKHKEITGDYVVIKRAIDQYKNGLVDSIKPLETKLGEELERIDKIKEEEKEAKERADQEKLQGRVNKLIEAGMTFNGSFYVIGENISLDVVTLKTMGEQEFKVLFDRVEVEGKNIREAEAKKKQFEKEEKQRLEKQRQDQDEERLRLQKENADLQAQKDAMEKQKKEMAEQRTRIRAARLEGLGMVFLYNSQEWSFSIPGRDIRPHILKTDVENESDDKFSESIESLSVVIADMKKQKKDLDEQEKRLTDRLKARMEQIVGLGYRLADGGYVFKSPYSTAESFITFDALKDQEDFTPTLKEAEAMAEVVRVEKEKHEALQQRTKERISQIITHFEMVEMGHGFSRIPKYPNIKPVNIFKEVIQDLPASEWVDTFDRLKNLVAEVKKQEEAEDKRLATEKESQRLALLSDKEKALEYLEQLWEIKLPEIESGEIDVRLCNLRSEIETVKRQINEL